MQIKSILLIFAISNLLIFATGNSNFSEEAFNQTYENFDQINMTEPRKIQSYQKMIKHLNQSILSKNSQQIINSTILLFTQLFEGMKQCNEASNKTKLLNFLNQLNYQSEQQEEEFNEETNIINICNKIYEPYDATINYLHEIINNNFIDLETNKELKTFFNFLFNDYQGLKNAGLFDQLIFLDEINLNQQQKIPQFEISFVKYEQFTEIMNLHFSLLQAINALFEEEPIDVIQEYFEVLDLDREQEKDIKQIEKMYLATYWNQVKEALQNEAVVEQGWKKLYYQIVRANAYRLRDECKYFDKKGIITKLQRNSEGQRKYLPQIECELKRKKLKKYVEKSENIDEL